MINPLPLVSIIMPAYNAQQYIAQAIESVINQTYINWELIIINDGSTDGTQSKIKLLNDNRIITLAQKNNGVSSARNLGLKKARGSYITFLDSDDLLPINSLQKRVDYLETNTSVDIVDGLIQIKDTEMANCIRTYQPYYEGKLLPKLLALDSRVFFNVCYLFRKDILGETQFNQKMTHAEDLLFYINLSSNNNVIYGYINEEIYYYRTGNTSAMINIDGLESGYLYLLKHVLSTNQASIYTKMLFRLKIAKIMLLSWLHKKKYKRAIKSFIKIMCQR